MSVCAVADTAVRRATAAARDRAPDAGMSYTGYAG